jgi:hypothetical protein
VPLTFLSSREENQAHQRLFRPIPQSLSCKADAGCALRMTKQNLARERNSANQSKRTEFFYLFTAPGLIRRACKENLFFTKSLIDSRTTLNSASLALISLSVVSLILVRFSMIKLILSYW